MMMQEIFLLMYCFRKDIPVQEKPLTGGVTSMIDFVLYSMILLVLNFSFRSTVKAAERICTEVHIVLATP